MKHPVCDDEVVAATKKDHVWISERHAPGFELFECEPFESLRLERRGLKMHPQLNAIASLQAWNPTEPWIKLHFPLFSLLGAAEAEQHSY